MTGLPRSLGSRGGSAGAAAPATATGISPRALLPPLVLAQFLASYDSSSMNVAISKIAGDLDTTVTGVQTAITLFTLTMAALMIPGSKLSDIWGRKRLFRLGICIYGTGALITAFSPVLAVMIIGWSLLEGIGSALMIPPIYILCTVSFDDKVARTKAFAAVSAAAGLGAASGPLIGGIITTAITWRASFLCEVLVILVILFLSRRLVEGEPTAEKGSFDLLGAVLSAAGLVFFVLGILQAGSYGWVHARKDFSLFGRVILEKGDISPVIVFMAIGLALLVVFGFYVVRRERHGKDPLIPLRILRGRTVILGLITQNVQWFMLIGTSFVISVFLQMARGYDALETGVVLVPATAGILLISTRMGRLSQRFSQRTVIRAGFVVTLVGILLVLLLNDQDSNVWLFVPGLFLFGAGAGMMLTASVNVVQSAVAEKDQGALSGVSRSVSNLGSSLGTAVAGAVLVSAIIAGISSRTADSTVLNPVQKQQLDTAMEGSVSAVSDQQVEDALRGKPPGVVDEVTRINREARNHALGYALISVGIVGLIGLGAALLLPAEAEAKKDEHLPAG